MPNVTEYESGDCYAKITEAKIYNANTFECLQYYSSDTLNNKIDELLYSFNEEKNIVSNEVFVKNFFYFLHALTYLNPNEGQLQNLSYLLTQILKVKQTAVLENTLMTDFFKLIERTFPLLFDPLIKQLPTASLINLQSQLFNLANSCLDIQHCQPTTLQKITSVLNLIKTKLPCETAVEICQQLQAKQSRISDYLVLANTTHTNTTLTSFTTSAVTDFYETTTLSQLPTSFLFTNSTNDSLTDLAIEANFDRLVSNTTNLTDVNTSTTVDLLPTHATFFSPPQEIIAARLGLEASLGLVQGITLLANDKLFRRFAGKNPSLSKKLLASISSTTLSAAINLARYPIAGPIVNPFPIKNTLGNLAMYFGSNLLTSATILTMTTGIHIFVEKFLGQGRVAQLIKLLSHLHTLSIAMLVMSEDFQKNPGLASLGLALNSFACVASYLLMNRLFPNPAQTDELTYCKNPEEQELLPIESCHKQTNSVLSTSNGSSTSTHTSQLSSDSAVNTDYSSDASHSNQSKLSTLTQADYYSALQEIEPNLAEIKNAINQLIPLINADKSNSELNANSQQTTAAEVTKLSRKGSLTNRILKTRDAYTVKDGLAFALNFIKALENLTASLNDETVYRLNKTMPQVALNELSHVRSMLGEIKVLAEDKKEALRAELARQDFTKKNKDKKANSINESLSHIKTIIGPINKLLAIIPERYQQNSNKKIVNHEDTSLQAKVPPNVFLSEKSLFDIKEDFTQLQTSLVNEARFEPALKTIQIILSDKILDFSCILFPNYNCMLQDKNVDASRSFFITISNALNTIHDHAIKLTDENKRDSVHKQVKSMKSKVDRTTTDYDNRNAFSEGRTTGIKACAKAALAPNTVTDNRTRTANSLIETPTFFRSHPISSTPVNETINFAENNPLSKVDLMIA
jgi:hypothetical protein